MSALVEPSPASAYPAGAVATSPEDGTAWLRITLEKLWLIVLMAIAGFFAGYGYLAHLAPLYQASGTLQIEPPRAEPGLQAINSGEPDLSTAEELNTLVEELVRPSFLLSVANDPALLNDPFLFPPRENGDTYSDEEKIRRLQDSVSVGLEKGTLLILVSAEHSQPATAQRICEAVLLNFVRERLESKSGSDEETYQFFLSEAERLGHALAEKEREMHKYDQLAKYDEAIAGQRALIAGLSQRYKAKYPAMIEARTLLQSLQDSFDAEMARILRAERDSDAAALPNPAPITDETRARVMGDYQVLKRDIETQRTLFASLSAQKNQSDVARAAQSETAVKIGDHPVLPETPVSRNPSRLLLTGSFLGLMLGIGLAFLLDLADSSLRTVDEVEGFIDLPVLSAVPEMHPRARKDKPKERQSFRGLPMLTDANAPPAEAIRSLRASLAMNVSSEGRHSMIFTSALPGEGKSFTAANYAVALASQGLKTLLIDADLRRPNLHAIFGATRDHVGLVDYLLEQAPLAEFVTLTSLPCLDLLLSGRAASHPAELLSRKDFARAIAEAAQAYDRVVVDTAPVNVVSDTLLLVPQVQSVCLVVRASSSPREAVRRAVRILSAAGREPVGAVFNRVTRRGLGYYHQYYYHYGSATSYGGAYEVASV